MKRVLIGVALVASLIVAASPALAADTYHWRNSGDGLSAMWTTVPWDVEVIPPGTYSETWVDASTSIDNGMGTYDTTGNGVCLSYWKATVDQDGNWTEETYLSACGDPTVFSVDKRLGGGRLVATLPVIECTEWDKETGECIGEPTLIGTFDIDLTLAGTGPIYRNHGTSSGGTAGFYQETSHGTGTDRAAIASGTVRLDGASVIGGATATMASLWSFRNGSVSISICKPSTGC
jgi:hypothetical protein